MKTAQKHTRFESSEPHPVDIHVGKRLRQRRTLLGMSQEAIGNAIGVTFQQIQKYERGINRMGASRLFDFSRALSIPVSYFFDEFAEAGAKAPAYGRGMAEKEEPFEHEKLNSRETLELVRAYYRISQPAVRKRMFELVKSLSDKPE